MTINFHPIPPQSSTLQPTFRMPSPDKIFDNWHGIIDDDFSKTIRDTFELQADDKYVYRAESFAMTLSEIQSKLQTGSLKYNYQSHGERIEVPVSPASRRSRRFTDSGFSTRYQCLYIHILSRDRFLQIPNCFCCQCKESFSTRNRRSIPPIQTRV